MEKIPYLCCPNCGKIESTPFAEGDECICGGKFILATDQLAGEFVAVRKDKLLLALCPPNGKFGSEHRKAVLELIALARGKG